MPSNVPTNAQYWECINGSWVDVTSLLGDNDGDNVLTMTITDGGLGDADGIANGIVIDQGGLVVQSSSISSIQESSSVPTAYQPTPARPAYQPTPARVVVKYIYVQPEVAQIGQPVTIIANVANEGESEGNYSAVLKINNQIEEIKTGSLAGRTGTPLEYTVVKMNAGTYSIDINGQKANFIIIGSNDTRDTHAGKSQSDGMLILLIACALCIIIAAGVAIVLRLHYYH